MHPIDQMDRAEIDAFIVRHWFTMEMVVRGENVALGNADGWYARDAGEVIGLLTYRVREDAMEILSLDSVHANNGIGTALLNAAVSKAKERNLSRVMLITTNDNLHALRFYQRRGFDIVRLYRNALDEARKIKPEIPLTGMDGIPLKHEIELERIL